MTGHICVPADYERTGGALEADRLLRRPGVIYLVIAQLLHRLLQVRDPVAVSGDAVGHDERQTVRLDRSAYQLSSVLGLSQADRSGAARQRRAEPRQSNRFAGQQPKSPVLVAATHAPNASTHAFVAPYRLPGRGGSPALDCVVSGRPKRHAGCWPSDLRIGPRLQSLLEPPSGSSARRAELPRRLALAVSATAFPFSMFRVHHDFQPRMCRKALWGLPIAERRATSVRRPLGPLAGREHVDGAGGDEDDGDKRDE
jgi:hypothetical protein